MGFELITSWKVAMIVAAKDVIACGTRCKAHTSDTPLNSYICCSHVKLYGSLKDPFPVIAEVIHQASGFSEVENCTLN
jgi:hypothetical protein